VAIVATGLMVSGCSSSSDDSSDKRPPATPGQTSDATESPEVFSVLPDYFLYASGAGGWGTVVEIDANGAFTGDWHDSEMGSNGPDYPKGTRYECTFEGRFVDVKQVNPLEYSMRVDGLTITSDPEPKIVDEQLIKSCEPGTNPLGFTNADEFRFYLPGGPVSALPQAVIDWEMLDTTQSLSFFVLYNVNGSESFRGETEG